MCQLGNGLFYAERHEEALSVQEAELSTERRLGGTEEDILGAQSNLANTYRSLGRLEDASRLQRDVYSGYLELLGEENEVTLRAAFNCAITLKALDRFLGFEEAKALMRRTIPVARRVLGESKQLTLKMQWTYAGALCDDTGATLDDFREAVTTLEETERIVRRVLGGAHPDAVGIGKALRTARAKLRASEPLLPPPPAREQPPPPPPSPPALLYDDDELD